MSVLRGIRSRLALLEAKARLAQSVEHQTFNLRVKGSSPLLGALFFAFRVVLEIL